ncbi:hypothetical protein X949_5148 [Burkholderia pseudomallei MSHR5609]|nr:hypothetical protein DO71_4774 [Burkholderia pseudomallei]KGS07767.1 hypothetical protein X948_1964 [Burkholderia pseudomallei MSHR5608]KGS16981.1 hypothetical protein X989_5621 [Burkholderia pseudomallei MSHR4378]KGS54669.1 hypothetical protein X949_5148 [Burkholderia pseudomallei MSHR5609]KGS84714.1 hypothetical protein X947_2837 [Burkholderia pseudomallei MSHR7334]KGS85934.1 hypothetical protein X976_3461 [Burkholderia pseudomallei MSHR7500]KGX54084.1 hypothetical protein Y024_5194 [Bur
MNSGKMQDLGLSSFLCNFWRLDSKNLCLSMVSRQ